MESDESYIKFDLDWIEASAIQPGMISEINFYRSELFNLGLIGQTEDGIGFGNISIRLRKNKFLISGSQTGGIPNLGTRHYTIVEKYDIDQNKVMCKGPVKASSESLTHAAVYSYSSSNAVIHVHNTDVWKKYINKLPTTKESVPYGTSNMAYEIKRILSDPENRQTNIIIMGGHEPGIILYGNSVEKTFREVKDLMN